MSTYLFTYRMRGGRGLDSLPVTAQNLNEAYALFHHAMGQNGCEYDQYTVVSYCQLPAVETSLQPV